MDIAEWFDAQRALQNEAFGVDPGSLEGEDLAAYVTWNAYALEDELHELTQEVQWKPWANDIGSFNKEAALREFVDMMHFMANIALALRFNPDEVTNAYEHKLNVNRERQRQEGGYDAIEAKCPHCKRDLLEVGRMRETKQLDELTVVVESCGGCGQELSRKVGYDTQVE